ncbi:hypothetical protein TTHERM_00575610 (macronuclear) [Tetrahymena thermophila SB210]|uniref:Uncharacterized protein n=1 Tax=Tetrahymena thermophila (strain SB210) TaxID=312017 RepID=Q22V39_TETTS|nr:hypothetical protein TTHERM_00575610 [Tetrahymena thermophila SB210]EAR89109.1 hypothetical protein TTHERM_00575610 [Tetrahymena thermophila SB210]|eukprot:XP_001009354.1 hypothetical protein TTHERM_00575610 [Tetrahymena thermophila SB210]
MKVNQLSQGFPEYLSHKQDQQNILKQQVYTPSRRVEFNHKRNTHQNIFSDQYHFLPSTQVKNPFLRQEFKIGEVKQNWVQLVDEKVLSPVEVYDCVLDQVQTVPRETIFMKNKDLYPQYYKEALNDGCKKEFRRISGPFMQQIKEINKMKPIIEDVKTPSKLRNQSYSNKDYYLSNNINNISSQFDISSDEKQRNSYSYQTKPILLRQSMLMEKSNFFTPNFKENDEVDEKLEEEKRNQYLSHDPRYINKVEHDINKELIQNSMKKQKSLARLNRDLKQHPELKSSKQFENSSSYNSLERINDLKRSVEFQQFEDELTKFEKSLKTNKKTNCAWMTNSNQRLTNKSQFMQQSQKVETPQSQFHLQKDESNFNSPIILQQNLQNQNSQNSSQKEQNNFNFDKINSNISNTDNLNTPSFNNIYNFHFKPSYSSSKKLDSNQGSQHTLAQS